MKVPLHWCLQIFTAEDVSNEAAHVVLAKAESSFKNFHDRGRKTNMPCSGQYFASAGSAYLFYKYSKHLCGCVNAFGIVFVDPGQRFQFTYQ